MTSIKYLLAAEFYVCNCFEPLQPYRLQLPAALSGGRAATAFCPAEFTVGELRRVYESVWGVALDPRNFHRKVTGTPGFLVPSGGTTTRQGGRPAQLFRAGGATDLNPPMLRPEP